MVGNINDLLAYAFGLVVNLKREIFVFRFFPKMSCNTMNCVLTFI